MEQKMKSISFINIKTIYTQKNEKIKFIYRR